MELVKKLLVENDYDAAGAIDDSVFFYQKDNEEFYIVADYTGEELLNFAESETSRKAYDLLEARAKVIRGVTKNTSIFVCIKVDGYKDFLEQYKNAIYSVEEDPYVFRKYVLVYTDEDRAELFGKTTDEIIKILQHEEDFDRYQNIETRYDNGVYFLALQLLVKMPFLELPSGDMEFQELSSRFDSKLSTKEKRLLSEIIDDDAFASMDNIYDAANSETSDNEFDEWLDSAYEKVQRQ